jgi:hypothetical protein
MAGFKDGIAVVFAEDVKVEDKIIVNGEVCKVVRISQDFRSLDGKGGHVAFDLFCYDRIGYFCYDQVFEVGHSFVEVLY